MKINVLLTFVILTSGILNAQTEKGNLSVNLHNYSPSFLFTATNLLAPTNAFGIGYTTQKSKVGSVEQTVAKVFSAGLSGSMHYFIADDFSGGANLVFYHANQKFEDDDDAVSKTTLFLAGPELRYYFNIASNMKFYLGGNTGFGTVRSKFEDSGFDDDDKTTLFTFGAAGGMSAFLSKNISLDFGVRYDYSSFKDKFEDSFSGDTEYEMNFSGVGLDVGFSVFFGGGGDSEKE